MPLYGIKFPSTLPSLRLIFKFIVSFNCSLDVIKTKLKRDKTQIENLNNIHLAHNPIKVISKGYAIIEDEEKNLITSKEQLKETTDLKISLKDGSVEGSFIPYKGTCLK